MASPSHNTPPLPQVVFLADPQRRVVRALSSKDTTEAAIFRASKRVTRDRETARDCKLKKDESRKMKDNAPSAGYRYATPRAFIGAAALAVEAAACESRTARAAIGFSHSRAMNAATRSHPIIAQKTLVHDPVLANNQAAPGPANKAATPLAV
jgi:hypothetical protein